MKRETKQKLNPKQEKFCQLYVSTGNGTQSYIDAGYSSNRNTADANAARLLGNDSVSARINELRKEQSNKFEVTRLDMLEWFHTIINLQTEETKDRIAAAKEINRMMGFYEPEKVEIGVEKELSDMVKRLTGNS